MLHQWPRLMEAGCQWSGMNDTAVCSLGDAQGMERCSNWGFSVRVTADGGGDQHAAQTHPVGLWALRLPL